MSYLRLTFKRGDNLLVFRAGTTSNEKICDNPKARIIQTYTLSRDQYQFIADGGRGYTNLLTYKLNRSNCLDCIHAGTSDNPDKLGTCYVNKREQGSGIVSMLKSIVREYPTWDDVPDVSGMNGDHVRQLVAFCHKYSPRLYVRFGSYGEPVFVPFPIVQDLVLCSDTHTGYTHQWRNPMFRAYRSFFMASTETETDSVGRADGWREFQVTETTSQRPERSVRCPASKEGGNRSSCYRCNLCGGTSSKSPKHVSIALH